MEHKDIKGWVFSKRKDLPFYNINRRLSKNILTGRPLPIAYQKIWCKYCGGTQYSINSNGKKYK